MEAQLVCRETEGCDISLNMLVAGTFHPDPVVQREMQEEGIRVDTPTYELEI